MHSTQGSGRLLLTVLLGALSSGCSLTRGIAIRSMVPILENTALAARERSDLGTVETALPANLLLVDGLIRTAPGNRDLLELGAYLYFGYALGFVESRDSRLASLYYATARDYGLRALERRSAFRKGRQGDLEAFRSSLASLRRSDAAAMAWTAASWGRWLSLNLDSPPAIAEMPRLEALLDRLLELDAEFEQGLPHALRGTYDSLRPEMFGGNPQRAKQHFDRALEISGRRMLLFQVFYAEFYCRQVLDEDGFVAALEEVRSAPVQLVPEARLMNEVARARAARLLELRSELF